MEKSEGIWWQVVIEQVWGGGNVVGGRDSEAVRQNVTTLPSSCWRHDLRDGNFCPDNSFKTDCHEIV